MVGLVSAAAVVALLSTTSSAANADSWVDHTPVVSFTMSDTGGFEFPTSWRAGFVTLQGSTTDATYHALQGFKPLHGHTPDEVVEALRKGVAGATLEESAEGHRWLLDNALLVGGVVTTLRGPVSVTIPLERGTYTFFDVNDIFLGITPRLHTVEVGGRWRDSPLPDFETEFSTAMQMSSDSTMSHDGDHPMQRVTAMMNRDDNPVFNAPLQLSAHPTTFRAVVMGDELHEVVVRPTLPGITNDYLKTYYDAVRDGTPRPPAPWKRTSTGAFERAAGAQAMSPHRWAIVSFDWDTGPYALLCLVPSADSGQPHAYIGMFHMLELV
jgi:hypothetical protein